MKLIATRGISNSFKSTWAMEWLAAAPNRARVNLDTIREHIFGATGITYADDQEALAQRVQTQFINEFLADGRDVVVDNTNLTNKRLRPLFNIAQRHGAEFIIKPFHASLEEAVERNAKRAATGGLFVPTHIIASMVETVQSTVLDEDLAACVQH